LGSWSGRHHYHLSRFSVTWFRILIIRNKYRIKCWCQSEEKCTWSVQQCQPSSFGNCLLLYLNSHFHTYTYTIIRWDVILYSFAAAKGMYVLPIPFVLFSFQTINTVRIWSFLSFSKKNISNMSKYRFSLTILAFFYKSWYGISLILFQYICWTV